MNSTLVTENMLVAAMKKAVENGLVPKYSPDNDAYVKMWNRLQEVVVAVMEAKETEPQGEVLRSSYDWNKQPEYADIVIYNPDGWDRQNYEASMNELISKKEFNNRLQHSTSLVVKQ